MQFKARVNVMPQKEILDPQGKAVEQALKQLGLSQVEDVRIGKRIEFNVQANDQDSALAKVTEAGKSLLANLIMEDFEIELIPME
jgi:phosphoribosylformylglycinamidine synthase